jgi:hypothetical protein
MEVIETSDSIKIQFLTDDFPYESIYNREYFLLLGIKIVESDEEKKVGGLYQFYKEKTKTRKEIDPLESTVSVANEHFKKSTDKIIENSLNGFFSSKGKRELVIKKDKSHGLKSLDKEIQEVYERARTIFNFDSGYTYNEYSNIIKDLYIQIAYMKFLRVKIEQIDFKRVFKINGRYVLLENNIKEMEEKEDASNYFLELERKLVELTGKKYEKGQIERDLRPIEGTEMWKYIELYLKGSA